MYFYPGHRIVWSVEEAATLDPSLGPVFVYADAEPDPAGLLPWLAGRDRAVIEYDHPEFPHRMIRWALNAGATVPVDVRGSAAPPKSAR
jgi:hypothetical protein